MSKTRTPQSITFKSAILASTVLTAGVGLGSIFLPSLRQSYPSVSDVMLKSFVSLPNAAQLIALLVVGWLSSRMGKRNTLMFASLLFTISGVLPMFANGFTIILIGRLLLGFSVGLAQPLGTALLADNYTDQERDVLMGYQSALSGFGNTALTFIAGLFIATSWRTGFIVYIIGVIIFALLWLFIPNDHVLLINNKNQNQQKSSKKIGITVIWWALAMFLFNMAYSSGILDFSLTVVETKVGSATTAANVTAGVALVSMFSGLIFGKYVQLTKRFAGLVAILLMLVGNVLIASTNVLFLFILGDIIIALAFGLFMPYVMTAVNKSSTEETSAAITGLTLSAGSIANFLSTYFYNIFAKFFGQMQSQFGFWCGAFCCALLVIELLFMMNKKLL
jgi:MFS family permease